MAAAAVEKLMHQTLLGEAVECANTAVFVWNDDRRYVAVNEAACELVGLTRSELVGMRVGDLTVDYDP
ncbi:MAG: PAS domain-containing protein, partial [Gaiellaceae bacterium]